MTGAWDVDRTNAHPYWGGRKVLAICERGNSRSVALGWLLKDFYRADCLCAGAGANTTETFRVLMDWAETIIVVDARLMAGVPDEWRPKVLLCDVGSDRFFRGFDEGLLARYVDFLAESSDDMAVL